MTMPRWARLSALFEEAVELGGPERASLLAAARAEDPGLAEALERLLDRDAALADSPTRPATEWLGEALEHDSVDRLLGTRAGPWRLEAEIGRGGMGRVFRAHRDDGQYQQAAAVKLVRRELLDPALLRRFSTERAVLAGLSHPNIARLLDAGVRGEDGLPYVVMELIDGAPLDAWCDARQLDLRGRVALFRRVLAGVAHAHARLVVHRDLKPGNVLVTAEGEPKLLDFGIAKPLGLQTQETGTAERFFTPATAAPEQLRGEPVGVACDVYGLGALLYALLCGRGPFDEPGLTPAELERRILAVPPPSLASRVEPNDLERARAHGFDAPTAWRRALSGDLERIVQRALRKAPEERYSSAEAFDADLGAWLEHRPIAARGGERFYRLRKFVDRHRFGVAAAGVATALAVAAIASILDRHFAMERERDRAQRVVEVLRSTFEAADPARTDGTELTAREIFAGAQRELDALAEGEPETFVDLAATMADVQLSLGLASDAAALAARALEQGASGSARDGLALLRGRALLSAGRFDEAERVLGPLMPAQREDRQARQILLGWLRAEQGRRSEAIAILRAAIAADPGASPRDALATLARLELADAQRRERLPDESLATLDALLAWQRAALPADHPRITVTRTRRVGLLAQAGRAQEALDEARQVVADAERQFGPQSAAAGVAWSGLGAVYARLARRDEAADAFARSGAIADAIGGPAHPNALRGRFNRAQMLRGAERWPERSRLYQEALDGARARFGPGHDTTRVFLVAYAVAAAGAEDCARSNDLLGDPALAERVAADPFARARVREAIRAVEATRCALSGPAAALAVGVKAFDAPAP